MGLLFSLPIDVNHGNIICILTYTRVSYIFLNLKIFKSGHFLHGYKQTKLTIKKKKLAIIHILVIVFPQSPVSSLTRHIKNCKGEAAKQAQPNKTKAIYNV